MKPQPRHPWPAALGSIPSPKWWVYICAAVAAAALASPAIAGSAALHDQAALEATLAKGKPCCVVDARAEDRRRQDPIDKALPYREGMRLNASSGIVVVIADTDARALEISRGLARLPGVREVVAVQGGVVAWRAAVEEHAASSLPSSFVIPSDTCQNAPPLQSLPFDKSP